VRWVGLRFGAPFNYRSTVIFFQFKILPWNLITKIAVSFVGLAILLTFMALLNSRNYPLPLTNHLVSESILDESR
jgi:hypothetical protein